MPLGGFQQTSRSQNGTHQPIVYANHVNLLSESMCTIKKVTQAVFFASKSAV
jgi:hypothetical protein